MPILTITVKGSELYGATKILLERPYKFTKLQLKHLYHNIDAGKFTAKVDKAGGRLLFVRLGNMTDGSRNVINYSGNYRTPQANVVPRNYNNADFQEGQGTLDISQTSAQASSTTRISQSIDIDHLIPIGATHKNSAEITSRDLFAMLHEGQQPLNFNGELELEVFAMLADGSMNALNATNTGGLVTDSTKGKPVSFMTLVFQYEELPF